MKTVNDPPKPEDSPQQEAGEGCSGATCSRSLSEWSKKELLALPHRKWDAADEEYDSLLIFSIGRNHESGWKAMAIVGCRKMIPVEICSSCSDDIEWKLPTMKTFGYRGEWSIGQMRMDCTPKAGILHAWCRDGRFRVGCALSSITVDLIPENVKGHAPAPTRRGSMTGKEGDK